MALIDLRSPIDPSMMERLNQLWRAKICPVCLTDTWNVEQQIAELRFLSMMPTFNAGGAVVPLVVVTCQTCGNTLLFNAVKLGWVPRTGVPPSLPGGGQ